MAATQPQTPTDALAGFTNEPLLELRRAAVRERCAAALAELDARLPLEVPILVGDEVVRAERFDSVDPCTPSRVVAVAHAATAAHVEVAVATARAGHREWSARTPAERAAVLRRAAGILRERRVELAALAVREVGKPWPEADADVAELLDFLELYASAAEALDGRHALLQPPGERNALRHVARGVTAVIAPWNFPLAIAGGMVAAALATGNAVVLKPAEQAPACAKAVVDALHAAGVPHAALALLPGFDEPGKALVADPRVATIAFTGSCAVGLQILERAARVIPGQRLLKKVVAEMGGKNCIVVDADADLDEAVPAIVRSAFGFAGQKCSAASRVLVHAAVAEELEARLAGAVETLRVGLAEDLAADVPAVVDPEARDRLEAAIAGAGAGRVVRAPLPEGLTGFFVAPALLLDVPVGSPVLEQELFGPVVAVERVPDLDAAIAAVDALPFALTGGVFTRSPATVDRVAAAMPVGNLYVNREITGAIVGRQPFGGGRLSGTGPKAGAPDYLLAFVEPRCVTENTVRHGLVV
jgi:RHH-type transcriptional regulator, proline utilization regulon repressor / proline dehydrogenase / delta 1-pyrroline-5-carboxylate dehydrogenase